MCEPIRGPRCRNTYTILTRVRKASSLPVEEPKKPAKICPMPCKSRELRGGVFYPTCLCARRNGLQYDCQRSECQGRIPCTQSLIPQCCPSIFARRFENIAMAKRTNPLGQYKIRVRDDGVEAIQFDPCLIPEEANKF